MGLNCYNLAFITVLQCRHTQKIPFQWHYNTLLTHLPRTWNHFKNLITLFLNAKAIFICERIMKVCEMNWKSPSEKRWKKEKYFWSWNKALSLRMCYVIFLFIYIHIEKFPSYMYVMMMTTTLRDAIPLQHIRIILHS